MKRPMIGVLKSTGENEKRIPIHPDHLYLVDDNIRQALYFQAGYGENFDYPDSFFEENSAGVMSRERLLQESDVVIILKPTPNDLLSMKKGAIFCGWAHCVQRKEITQAAIDNQLTLITFEAMNYWKNNYKKIHVFQKNNEIAGCAGVTAALQICGFDPAYGSPLNAVVIGFGATGRGAVHGLKRSGVRDITVYSKRHGNIVVNQIPGILFRQIVQKPDSSIYLMSEDNKKLIPILDGLKKIDIIVNAVLQDTNNPMTFLKNDEVQYLKKGALLIDISADPGMGFEFASEGTFSQPTKKIENITYFCVPATPAYVWKTASLEISKSFLPFLRDISGGMEFILKNITLSHAIEIENGVIKNPDILAYQYRDENYPHEIKAKT